MENFERQQAEEAARAAAEERAFLEMQAQEEAGVEGVEPAGIAMYDEEDDSDAAAIVPETADKAAESDAIDAEGRDREETQPEEE